MEPNNAFRSIEEIQAWIQINIPGGEVLETYEVKMFRCKIALPEKSLKEQPNICPHTNLFIFETESKLNKFNDEQCGHLPMVSKWECKHCSGFHYWSTASTDTNGGYLGGSFKITPYLRKLIDNTAKYGTVKTFERD